MEIRNQQSFQQQLQFSYEMFYTHREYYSFFFIENYMFFIYVRCGEVICFFNSFNV